MEKQSVLSGAFIGLLYVVFLPVIGTVIIIGLLAYKLVKVLRASSKSPHVPQDREISGPKYRDEFRRELAERNRGFRPL